MMFKRCLGLGLGLVLGLVFLFVKMTFLVEFRVGF